MPVSVIVGGQFGSEGKGKVAHEFARMRNASVAVRVGGSNSGHTVIDPDGIARIFRHLPTAAILPDVTCVIGAGAYLDVDVLLAELDIAGLSDDRLIIDPNAVVITERNKEAEKGSGLREKIGSTASGTGAAVVSRVSRDCSVRFAKDDPRLSGRFVGSASKFLRERLNANERIILEGTQGFGLSVLHSEHYPYVSWMRNLGCCVKK